ncbi:MAG: biopolymer transporter ExbD [Planctomycetota bacterium]
MSNQRRSGRGDSTRKRASGRSEAQESSPDKTASGRQAQQRQSARQPQQAQRPSARQPQQEQRPSARQPQPEQRQSARQPQQEQRQSARQPQQEQRQSARQPQQASGRQTGGARQPSQRAQQATATGLVGAGGAGGMATIAAKEEQEEESHRKKRRRIIVDAVKMDMTPMIDVVFQLLIFFLCATKFKTVEDIFNANLPQDEGLETTISPEKKEKPPPIHIGIIDESPKKDSPDPDIKYGRTATFLINGQRRISHALPEHEINGQLLTLFTQQSQPEETEVQIYPYKNGRDNKVPFKEVIRIMDLCYKAKIKDIRFRPPVDTFN